MNIGKRELSDSDFEDHYRVISREMGKLISSNKCSGSAIAENIYALLSSRDSDVEKLYWRFGDFFYYFAKSKRKMITTSNNWFKTYCDEFQQYSYVLENISSLCAMLNGVLESTGRGRKINEYGYLIWDKSVIQPLNARKTTSFSAELHKRMFLDDPLVIIGLESLKKIVPNIKDPFYIYEILYEKKAMQNLEDFYRKALNFKDIKEFIMVCVWIWDDLEIKLLYSFLPESYQKVKNMIEKITILENKIFLEKNLYLILINNFMEFSLDCNRLSCKSMEFKNVSLEVIRKYVRNSLVYKIKTYFTSEDPTLFFIKLKETIEGLKEIIKQIYSDQTCIVDESFSEEIKNFAGFDFNKKMVEFSDFCIKNKNYETNTKLYQFFIGYCKDKNVFFDFYVKHLMNRLLEYKYPLSKEIYFKDIMKNIFTKMQTHKLNNMIQDIYKSIMFNKSIPLEKSHNMIYKDGRFRFFTSILNFCIWPHADESLHKNILLPPDLQNYIENVTNHFNEKSKSNKLHWNWDIGYVDISINLNKEYSFRVNIYQYIVIEKLNSFKKESTKNISDLTGLNTNIVNSIINTFSKIGIVKITKEEVYINKSFDSDNTNFIIHNIIYDNKSIKIIEFDLKTYYKAKISSICKITPQIKIDLLFEELKNNHLEDFEFNKELYIEALNDLCDIDIIEIKDGQILYDV